MGNQDGDDHLINQKNITGGNDGLSFKDLSFTANDLRGKEFYNCTFTNCNFSEIDLVDSKYFNTTFSNCNFSNSKYSDTQLREVTFIGCKLIGAGFSEKNLAFSANFSECDLRYAEFLGINLSEKTFHRSTLNAARFTNCKLRGSNFSESSFKDAIFYNCNLQDAIFTEVKNLFINPMENKIKNTSIDILAAGNIINHFGFNID